MVRAYRREAPNPHTPWAVLGEPGWPEVQKAEDFVSDQAHEDMDDWMRGAIEHDDWYNEDIETRADHIAERLMDSFEGEFEPHVLKRLHKTAFKAALDAAETYFREHPGMRETYYNERAIARGDVD